MGSAASTERAERRRRERTPGHSGASSSTAEPTVAPPQDPSASADVRRKGSKVAPEPNEGEESLPGSPSFRIYCQEAAQVDALVADTAEEHAYVDHGDGLATATDMTLAIRKNDLPHCSGEMPKSKEGWLKFRGQAIVDTLYGLIICRSKTASAHPHHPHHHPPAAKPPRPSAPPAATPEPYL